MGFKNFIKCVFETAKDLVYPPNVTCDACGDEVFADDNFGFCDKCKVDFNEIFCIRCGRGIKNLQQFCDRCISPNTVYHFDFARSVFNYNDTAQALVYRFKSGNGAFLREPLSDFLLTIYNKEFTKEKINYALIDKAAKSKKTKIKKYILEDEIEPIVCSVPMHQLSQRKRGYNQSALLASMFAKKAGLKYLNLLAKEIKGVNLKELSREARLEAIKDSFSFVNEHTIKGKDILLIDDVLTTCATASECARILKKNGARLVFILTVASVKIIPVEKIEEESKKS